MQVAEVPSVISAMSYSVSAIRALEQRFNEQKILRPLRELRHEPGTLLEYEVRGVIPDARARVKLEVEKFVGGGFAGQVYKVRLLSVERIEGEVAGIEAGRVCALKVLVPPSGFSRIFRNFMYGLAFQGPFSLQVNPAAARSQALWQKFIRRAARIDLGSEDAVADVLATLVDTKLGSCGEIVEWIEGRVWRFEADDNLDARRKRRDGEQAEGAGSPEYGAKRSFMARLVRLMHELGARELARQYEWWSLKSQPNALKRLASDPDPEVGLTAVDFRAGLALLPFAPMCPVDFKLILDGIGRGDLVQFDRGDVEKLEGYVKKHSGDFADMQGALQALKKGDETYRGSLPDVTHHHVKLVTSGRLRASIKESLVESWTIRGMADGKAAERLGKSGFLVFLFYLLGIVPFLGKLARRLWGREDYRRHYGRMLLSAEYFSRAVRARSAEALIGWHRAGRVSEKEALRSADSQLRFFSQLPLSFLPAGLHRLVTDWDYFKERLHFVFVRPFKLYFNPQEREKWIRGMIEQGEGDGMLSREEAGRINEQIKEPFIQKYLKSLAVHFLLMPTTHVVALAVAIVYVKLHPELTWQQATLATGLILGFFQIIPVSPGSLARGIYTSSLVLSEKNFKDYSIAFALSFFKYIGYLAFPIQMAYRYPDLARFMAGHWSTSAVHVVPVFGEKGAWLEHFVFDAFYNFPLTVRRRVRLRSEARAGQRPRYWHMPPLAICAAGILAVLDFACFKATGRPAALREVWWAALWAPLLCSALVSRMAAGATLGRRIGAGALGGSILGPLYTLVNVYAPALYAAGVPAPPASGGLIAKSLWLAFLFTIIAVIGALVAETRPVKAPAAPAA